MLYEVLKYVALYRGVRNEWRRSRRQRGLEMAEIDAILKQAYIGPIRDALYQPSVFMGMLDRELTEGWEDASDEMNRQVYTYP